MSDVVKLPVCFRRKPELTPREIWRQSENVTDLMVWEVCPYLRNLEPCSGCKDYDEAMFEGELISSKRGCRALAEEACRVMLAAREKGNGCR